MLQCAQLFIHRLLVTCQMPCADEKALGQKKEEPFSCYLRLV